MRALSCFTKAFLPILLISLAIFLGCNNTTIQATHTGKIPSVEPFRLSSPDFTEGGKIPMLYTCDSTNISPALYWNNPFHNTGSFALIMDDPDVPTQAWVHWIVYNIPATDTSLAAHFPMDSVLANGTKQGFTSFQITGYGGPCPPNGIHRYYFKLYALDAKLNVRARLTKTQLLNAMKGHILAEADLMGKYIKKNNDQ
jgi:Raf kinase inhibitor-like YbhB/YbcL family protein